MFPSCPHSVSQSRWVESLLLDGGVEDYEYLNKSRREVDGIDDVEEWAALKVSKVASFHPMVS